MNYELNIKDFHLVKKDGYPKDDTICFIIFKSYKQKNLFSVGAYHKDSHQFYVNFGLGGCVIEDANVIAWKEWNDKDIVINKI